MPVSSRSKPQPSQRMGRVSTRTGKPIIDPTDAKAVKKNKEEAFKAAEKSVEFLDQLRAHYRETRRTPVTIPAQVKVILKDGSVFDAGKAIIKNVSPSGALLGEVELSGGVYPTKEFKLELLLEGGEYEGIGIEAIPVRFVPEDSGLGVKFEEIFVSA